MRNFAIAALGALLVARPVPAGAEPTDFTVAAAPGLPKGAALPGPERALAVAPPPAFQNAQPIEDATRGLVEAALRNSGLFAQADAGPGGGVPPVRTLVIDPLIDRVTNYESAATRAIERVTAAVVAERFPQVRLRPMGTAALAEKPLILLGSIAPLGRAAGPQQASLGPPFAYQVSMALVDSRNGRVLSRPVAWVRAGDVDPSPVPFHRDAPVWMPDGAQDAYLRTVAAEPGSQADWEYMESLAAEALIQEGMAAFKAGNAEDAANRFNAALRAPRGQQLRSYNGLYLAHVLAGDRRAASASLDKLLEFGSRSDRMVLKVLFRPGLAVWSDKAERERYSAWVRRLAVQLGDTDRCTLVAGHASATGTTTLNDILSLRRARYVRDRMLQADRRLRDRLGAQGFGSSQNLIGFGTDNWQDAMDRRVEFHTDDCVARTADAGATAAAD